MSNPSTDTQPTNQNRRITTSKGSPFSPGIPLEAHQPIFGRDDAFRFISGELMRFKSVNLIGERRMGKTSLLKHLLGNQDKYLQPHTQQPPLVLIHVDLQDNINKAEQFYGKALRGLLEALPVQTCRQALESWRARLREHPEATAIEFENFLYSLKEAESGRVHPVFLIDEFERVFEQHLKAGFPFPDFYDGLRAQITANRVALVLFTRKKLITYFTQQSLTSTFPSYFQPFKLSELEKEAADALLLRQPSNHPLTTEQARQARSWAGLHPCRLQCAGADQLRIEVQRELKSSLAKEEYEALKGTMWLFRRNPEDLDQEERRQLALLFECAPDLKRAYDLREQLTAIFETDHSKESGTAAIKRWMKSVSKSGLTCFDSFLTTLENWMDEITNYFVGRQTSGFVEGFNNKLKVLKRRCYGITNLTHLFRRLYLDLEGYRLFGL